MGTSEASVLLGFLHFNTFLTYFYLRERNKHHIFVVYKSNKA